MNIQPKNCEIVITQTDGLAHQEYSQPLETFEILLNCQAVENLLEAFPTAEEETVFTYTRS